MLSDTLNVLSHWLSLNTSYSRQSEAKMDRKLLKLKRTYYGDATLGQLIINGNDNPVFFTIERPWLDNAKNISCIPEGHYAVQPYSSKKFKDVYEITNVTGRSHILIHVANWASQVEGCIGVGYGQGYMLEGGKLQKAVTDSRGALESLKREIGYPASFDLLVTS